MFGKNFYRYSIDLRMVFRYVEQLKQPIASNVHIEYISLINIGHFPYYINI